MQKGTTEMTLIKRYSNRKLYDTKTSKYVTLLEIGDRIKRGEYFRVIDNHVPSQDLTVRTLAQVLLFLQDEKPTLGVEQLHALIRAPIHRPFAGATPANLEEELDRAE